jgi:predicted RNase H-like nuclease
MAEATVAGADWVKGRWIVAEHPLAGPADARQVSWSLTDALSAALTPWTTVLGVDIPIGLPDQGVRAADQLARMRLGAARARVFLVPPREVIESPWTAGDPRLQALARRTGGRGVSAQALGLRRAILGVDHWLRSDAAAAARVAEVHPELSFQAMAGRSLASKRTAIGVAERVTVLAREWRIDPLAVLALAPPGVPIDDCLDALAACWTASRVAAGTHEVLGDGAVDRYGLRQQLHV